MTASESRTVTAHEIFNINKLNPEIIDVKTQGYLNRLLFTIEKYRMIDVKRDRLKYMYEQNKARALRESIPNPIGLLSATSSFRLDKIAMSVLYMAVDSVTSYNAYKEQLNEAYLKDGWALDDEAAAELNISRSSGFDYLLDMVRDYKIPEQKALTEESVKDFVNTSNISNPSRRIQFYEAYKSEYEYFEIYWLELLKAYYENGQYQDALYAMRQYEQIRSNLFKENRDYCYAKYLPYAILAAEKCYGGAEPYRNMYKENVEKFAALLNSNANRKDWASKYFAAQTYVRLYGEIGDKKYLETAFTILKNNINDGLIEEQRKLNNTYLNEVKEVIIPENAEEEEEDNIEEYNKKLKKDRDTALPPVYEPLVLNLDLLFSLVNELGVYPGEKDRINTLLNGNDEKLFLSEVLNRKYQFDSYDLNLSGVFEKTSLTIPVLYLSENTSVVVEVTENGETKQYTDWVVEKVERPNSDVQSFKATFVSKEADKQEWSKNTTVRVMLSDDSSSEPKKYYLYFKAREEYRPIIPNKIVFDLQS